MTASIRRLLLAAGAVAGLLPCQASAGQAHVPTCLRRAALRAPAAATRQPWGADWSAVLADVPVPAGAVLAFFEVRPEQTPVAVADYAVDSMDAATLGRWYRDSMSGLGWQLAQVSAASQTWRQGTRWLRVDLPGGTAGRWLQLWRDAAGVRPAAGRSLQGALPLPASARRWRFDRADLLAEEVRVAAGQEEAGQTVVQALTGAGWLEGPAGQLAGTRVLRFSRAGGTVLAAVRQATATESEIGIGTVDCLASVTVAERTESVYLEDFPAPADSVLAGFERGTAGEGLERWRAGCQDLDLLAAQALAAWTTREWSSGRATVQRGPSTVSLAARPPAGSTVTATARAMPAGGVETVLARAADGLCPTTGRSLLFADLPLPAGAQSQAMTHDQGADWPWQETYALTGAAATLGWYRLAMLPLGWRLLRPVAAGDESSVYYAGGEEVEVTAPPSEPLHVDFRRRRSCPSDEPGQVPSQGGHARHLTEMPIFPGAVYEGYEEPAETYTATCTSLDQLEAWYRVALEKGNWSLAMIVGPEDPYSRTLSFVRPSERAVPPEQRTAWAEVELERLWSYTYVLAHRRDPGGVLPGQATP